MNAIIFFFSFCLIVGVILLIRVIYKNSSTTFDKPKPTPRPQVHKIEKNVDENKQAIDWLANFFQLDSQNLTKIISNIPDNYTSFRIRKRSRGYRLISAPKKDLLKIQQQIYFRILADVPLHQAAVGFSKKKSIRNNAEKHLGGQYLLKIDLKDFFPSIRRAQVLKVFLEVGYPKNVAKAFSYFCCLKGHLPQGAPTSPALSNIICRELDQELFLLAQKNSLVYTRYADDLTFSGDSIDFDIIFKNINEPIKKYGFKVNYKKTRRVKPNKRKIVTGISISSGTKMTIPRSKKREIRQKVFYIKNKGLESHLNHISSKDPSYMKRLISYLNFWLHIEPKNQFVKKSIVEMRIIAKKY